METSRTYTESETRFLDSVYGQEKILLATLAELASQLRDSQWDLFNCFGKEKMDEILFEKVYRPIGKVAKALETIHTQGMVE